MLYKKFSENIIQKINNILRDEMKQWKMSETYKEKG